MPMCHSSWDEYAPDGYRLLEAFKKATKATWSDLVRWGRHKPDCELQKDFEAGPPPYRDCSCGLHARLTVLDAAKKGGNP